MEKQRKSGKNEMQLKTGRKAWKTAKQDFRKLFANSSQPLRISQCVGNQFRIAKFNSPVHCTFAKFASHKTLAKFRIAKFAMCWQPLRISQCQFRNANFAMPISQCQFRNANFTRPIHCSFVSHKTSKP